MDILAGYTHGISAGVFYHTLREQLSRWDAVPAFTHTSLVSIAHARAAARMPPQPRHFQRQNDLYLLWLVC